MPRLFRQTRWYRPEPNAKRQGKGEGSHKLSAELGHGCAHLRCSPPDTAAVEPNRARPLRLTALPLTAPSSDSTTYSHRNEYSPVIPAKWPVPPRKVPTMRFPVPTHSPFNSL